MILIPITTKIHYCASRIIASIVSPVFLKLLKTHIYEGMLTFTILYCSYISAFYDSERLFGKCRNQVDGRGLKAILENFDL
jgi:hypothetical protein